MNAAFDELFAQTSGASDVVVRSESAFDSARGRPRRGSGSDDREPVPASVVDEVLAVPGVAVAVGDVQGYAQMIDPATDEVIGGVGPPTIGTNWNDLAGEVLSLRGDGVPPAGPRRGGDRRRDRSANANLADRRPHPILFQGPPGEFTIVGIAGFGEADNLGGATLAVFDTATAQRCSARRASTTRSASSATRASTASELRASVAAALPDGVEAVTSTSVADEQRRRRCRKGWGSSAPRCSCSRRRAVRGLVHHLQHVLDHRRAAHPGARAAAGARRVSRGRS